MLKGVVCYCEDKKNALCYIEIYEQKIISDDDSEEKEVEIKIGY